MKLYNNKLLLPILNNNNKAKSQTETFASFASTLSAINFFTNICQLEEKSQKGIGEVYMLSCVQQKCVASRKSTQMNTCLLFYVGSYSSTSSTLQKTESVEKVNKDFM